MTKQEYLDGIKAMKVEIPKFLIRLKHVKIKRQLT